MPPPEDWSGVERLKSKNEFATPTENEPRQVNDKTVSKKEADGAEEGKEGSKGGKDDDQERGEHLEGETAEQTVERVFASQSDVASKSKAKAGEREGGGDAGSGTVDNEGEGQEGGEEAEE